LRWSNPEVVEKTAFPRAMFLGGILGVRHPDSEREERSIWAVVDPHLISLVISPFAVVVAQRRPVARQTAV
jgi:hypothetical protein